MRVRHHHSEVEVRNKDALPIAELVQQSAIEYIPFPAQLVGKYQSFTEADLTRLRVAGYKGEFASVEEGVTKYVAVLAGK